MMMFSPPFYGSLIVFIFGAVIGSFLNVCIVRLPNRESVIYPRSRCPQCKVPIPFHENISLLSCFFRATDAFAAPKLIWLLLLMGGS